MLKSKTGKLYFWNEVASTSVLNNDSLLSEYSLKELDNIYKSNNLGNFEFLYKDILLKQVTLYDKSENVNSFIYKGNSFWLDKQQRSCMKTVAESGLENIEVILGNNSAILPASFINQFILDLEAYAYKCYVNTSKHQNAIKALQTVEEVLNYDYTTGYPDKIILE